MLVSKKFLFLVRIILAGLLFCNACGRPIPRPVANGGEASDSPTRAATSATVAADTTPTDDYEGEDEMVSMALFQKFSGRYSVTIDRFFLDTKDSGTIPVEFQGKYTFGLFRPDSIVVETSLVSDVGSHAVHYPQLTLLGGAYAQGPDTLHIYLGQTKLNGRPASSKEARLDFEPPFALFYSAGKIFMETEYIH